MKESPRSPATALAVVLVDVLKDIQEEAIAITVCPSRYVTIALAAAMTGYSVKAIQRKIEGGTWLVGEVCIRAPDGRLLIDMQAYERWVTSGAKK